MAELQLPRMDFSALGELPSVYRDARDRENQRMSLANLGAELQSGNVDYTQAASRALSSGNAQLGLSLLKLGEDQKTLARQTAASEAFTRGLTGGQPAAVPSAPTNVAPQSAAPNYGNAISSIESGGNYSALGPVITSGQYAGDRAVGKYQVMGKNVPSWTQEVLGRPMTPQEFAASPEAQDKVFQAKFGSLVQKYGPEGAAKAWFAGEGGMNDPNRRDQLGTTVSAYGQKFTNALGPQLASLGGAPTPDSAPPVPQGPQVAQAGPAPMQAPQQGGLDLSPRMLQLIGAMNHPSLPAAQKEIAKTLLTREMDAAKLPDAVKQYVFAKGQGYGGSFVEYQTEIRKAGATTVNVDQKGEGKFEEEFGKKQADRWAKYIDNADAAERKLVDINTMREISTRMGSQGAVAGLKEAIGPYAEAFGINVEGLSDIQAYSQVIQRMAPQQRAIGSGSTSDIEFKGMLKSLPGLMQHPAAREMGLNTMEALARDDIARGEIASRLASKEINPATGKPLTRAEAERELRALPDPMKGFVEWRKANPELYGQSLKAGSAASAAPSPPKATGPVRVNSAQERDALDRGTPYIAPDGSFRTKQ